MQNNAFLIKTLSIIFIFKNINATEFSTNLYEGSSPFLSETPSSSSLQNAKIQEEYQQLLEEKEETSQALRRSTNGLALCYHIPKDCLPFELAIEAQVKRLEKIEEQLKSLKDRLSSEEISDQTTIEETTSNFIASPKSHTNSLSQQEPLQNSNTIDEINTYIKDLEQRLHNILSNPHSITEKAIQETLNYYEEEVKKNKEILSRLKKEKEVFLEAPLLPSNSTIFLIEKTKVSEERSVNPSYKQTYISPSTSIKKKSQAIEDYTIHNIEKDLKKKIENLEIEIKTCFLSSKRYSLGVTLASCKQQLDHIKKSKELEENNFLKPSFSSDIFSTQCSVIKIEQSTQEPPFTNKRDLQKKWNKFQNNLDQTWITLKNYVSSYKENFSVLPSSFRG